MTNLMQNKRYLGDGVYAEYDGYGIVLTTSNGIEETNKIYFEDEVVRALLEFIDTIRRKENDPD